MGFLRAVIIGLFLNGFLANAGTLENDFQSMGFTAFQGRLNPIPVLNAHEFYFSSDLRSTVFLRFGLPEGEIVAKEGEFFHLEEEDYVVYLRDQQKQRYAVIFSNVDQKNREFLKTQIEANFKRRKPVLEAVTHFLLPSA